MALEVLHLARLALLDRVDGVAGQENALAHRHRAGCARSGKGGSPDDIFFARPQGRHVFLRTRAQPVRSTELGPVRGDGETGPERAQASKNRSLMSHGSIPPINTS